MRRLRVRRRLFWSVVVLALILAVGGALVRSAQGMPKGVDAEAVLRLALGYLGDAAAEEAEAEAGE